MFKADYPQQLRFVFDRPVTKPEWYWSIEIYEEEDPFDGDNYLVALEFIEQLCKQPKKDLAPYSDDQVGNGLNFIFSNSCSNLSFGIKNADVPFERRLKALRGLFNLYAEVFEPRCPAVLSANSSASSGPMTFICYMFWDICPLSIPGPGTGKEDWLDYYKAIAEVMQKSLQLRNVACIESGLHGLGHMVFENPKVAKPIIEDFLRKRKGLPEALLNYARAAQTGMIL
jgi:hypothetical protein